MAVLEAHIKYPQEQKEKLETRKFRRNNEEFLIKWGESEKCLRFGTCFDNICRACCS